MRPIVLDKISSVTLNCRLSREVRLGDELPCREGDVIAVRVLNRKATYNQLELATGRMSLLRPGDVIAGALGHRRALVGYAGRMPDSLAVGDRVNLLNLGGVLGICESENPDLGAPFECAVEGQVLSFPYVGERIGVPATITAGQPARDTTLDSLGVPVIAVAGTCMNSGKTFACTTIIQELVHRGLKVHAAKATGISLRRDVLAMEDAGASLTMVFTDLGVVTTTRENSASLSITMLNRLAVERPDVIVLELGDGLLGDYGVDSILAHEGLQDAMTAVVLAASDPVGAWGGLRILREQYGIEATCVTGPTTDNAAGTDKIEADMGVPARNARVAGAELTSVVCDRIGLGTSGGRSSQ